MYLSCFLLFPVLLRTQELNIMLIDVYDNMLTGAGIGLMIGLAPALTAIYMNRNKYATASLIACAVIGGTLGPVVAAIIGLCLAVSVMVNAKSFQLASDSGATTPFSSAEKRVGIIAVVALIVFIVGVIAWYLS